MRPVNPVPERRPLVAATNLERNELDELCDWLFENRANVHYPPIVNGRIERQVRVSELGVHSPADIHRLVLRPGGLTVDCSQMEIVKLLAVGLAVSEIDGATSTLLADPKLRHYSDPRGAYNGALAVYGPGGGHHITSTRHRDPWRGNPMQFSQGQESDPRFIPLLTEAKNQPAPVTMLSIAGL